MDICLECFSVVNENSKPKKAKTIFSKIAEIFRRMIDALVNAINSFKDTCANYKWTDLVERYKELNEHDIYIPVVADFDAIIGTVIGGDERYGDFASKIDENAYTIGTRFCDDYMSSFMSDKTVTEYLSQIEELIDSNNTSELKTLNIDEDFLGRCIEMTKINPKPIIDCSVDYLIESFTKVNEYTRSLMKDDKQRKQILKKLEKLAKSDSEIPNEIVSNVSYIINAASVVMQNQIYALQNQSLVIKYMKHAISHSDINDK